MGRDRTLRGHAVDRHGLRQHKTVVGGDADIAGVKAGAAGRDLVEGHVLAGVDGLRAAAVGASDTDAAGGGIGIEGAARPGRGAGQDAVERQIVAAKHIDAALDC